MTTSKKNKIKFARVDIKLGLSRAYLSLGKPATNILTYALFQMEWVDVSRSKNKSQYVCMNKDNIKLLYATFTRSPFLLKAGSITRGIDELLAKGFISIKEQGGSKKGHASIYSLSDAYLKWNKGDNPIETRRPFSKRGFCK